MSAKRIQLSRRRGWRKPDGAVVVSRPSKWGNRWRPGDPDVDGITPMTRARAVERYRVDVSLGYIRRLEIVRDLRGKDLACWCPLPAPGEPDICHAAVLLEIANARPREAAKP